MTAKCQISPFKLYANVRLTHFSKKNCMLNPNRYKWPFLLGADNLSRIVTKSIRHYLCAYFVNTPKTASILRHLQMRKTIEIKMVVHFHWMKKKYTKSLLNLKSLEKNKNSYGLHHTSAALSSNQYSHFHDFTELHQDSNRSMWRYGIL